MMSLFTGLSSVLAAEFSRYVCLVLVWVCLRIEGIIAHFLSRGAPRFGLSDLTGAEHITEVINYRKLSRNYITLYYPN